MFTCLKTAEVWEVEGPSFDPSAFFASLPKLVTEGDTLVIGSYNPSDSIYQWLTESSPTVRASDVYTTTYEFNLCEFPRGRAYELPYSPLLIDCLIRHSRDEQGSRDRQLFFEHVLAYRGNQPVLPLFNFHDAFSGGLLYLSGLYEEVEVEAFAKEFGASVRLVKNPEYPQSWWEA